MNRRSFIGTLTALAGVVLAKIKAPADYLALTYSGDWRRGVTQVIPQAPITAVRKTLSGFVVFSQNKAYVYDYALSQWRRWKHPISEEYGRLLTLNEYEVLVDTCKHCGAQAHPGYELICVNHSIDIPL